MPMAILLSPIRSRFAAGFFVAAAFLPILLSPLPAGACEIVVVKSSNLKPYQDVLRGFQDTVTCTIHEVKSGADDDDLVSPGSPNAVLAIGTAAFKKVRTLTTLPVIYTMVMPQETSLPSGMNVSGVGIDLPPEVFLATMKDLFPKAQRVGLLFDPRYTAGFVAEATKAAKAAGIELVTIEVGKPSKIPAAVNGSFESIDILWMLPDPTVVTEQSVEFLLRFSFQHAIPIFTFSKKYVEMGAVASLDIDPYDMGAQAGDIANSLVAGKPGPYRVAPRSSHLSVNAAVAAKMGIKLKAEIVKNAGKVD